MEYARYISIDPNIRFGKACITGTRISVFDVQGWLSKGMSVEQVIEDFPELETVQIQACLAYAADREHRFRAA